MTCSFFPNSAVFVLGAGLIAGCASGPSYITNSADIVKAADWKNTQTVTVKITEHDYTPRTLKLKIGQAYKLEMKNMGDKDHYYTAPDFYKAIATRKAMVNKFAEIKAPYFDAFEILKKSGQIDLYFVPVKAGTYAVYCTIDDHREKGMEGTITVE